MSVKYILVTGSHRSGSTWVGNVLSSIKKTGYIHEPFHLRYKDDSPLFPFRNIFPHVSENNKTLSQSAKEYLDEHVSKELKDHHTHFVLKDPMAFFSTDWIVNNYDAAVIICMRHPLAFVASIKKKNWTFNFRNLYKQKSLLKDHLIRFIPQIEHAIENELDIIDQGILLWNIFSYISKQYLAKNNSYYLVKNEDVSINPFWQFNRLCNFLGIESSKELLDYIDKTTNPKKIDRLSRVSAQNIYNWAQLLSKEEIERINEGTKDYFHYFYSPLSNLVPNQSFKGDLLNEFKLKSLEFSQELNFNIDRINNLKLTAKHKVEDTIKIQRKDLSGSKNSITLKGRAFNNNYMMPAREIYFQIGSHYLKGISGIRREDVSKKFNDINLSTSGFSIEIPTDLINVDKPTDFNVILSFQNIPSVYTKQFRISIDI